MILSCFRREELKEKLREKLELERRALKVVERLLEDSVSEDFLIDCVCFTDFPMVVLIVSPPMFK